MKRYAFIIIIVVCIYSSALLNAKESTESLSRLTVKVKNGLVSLEARNVELSEILMQISLKTGIPVKVDPELKRKVTIKVKEVDLIKLIRLLCRNRAVVYVRKNGKNRIVCISVYGKSRRKNKPLIKSRLIRDAQGHRACASKKQERDYKGRLMYKPGELLVRFKDGVSDKQIADLHRAIGSKVLDQIPSIRLQRVKLPDGLSIDKAIKFYMDSGIVEHVERHALRYIYEIIPDDPYFENQWGPKKIKVPKAWDISRGGLSVVVAVIDSGVDYSHPDLAQNIWINQIEANGKKGVDDDGNGYIDDIHGWDLADNDNEPMDIVGHGTNISGIIGAVGNNNIGITGTCWTVKIMPLKVVADDSDSILEMDIIKAIYYAIDNGADIVNCSFGGNARSEEERNAFIQLKKVGILAVCSAGNDGLDNDKYPLYPASYNLENIISVGASDKNDNIADFSNYGKTSVNVLAPGVSIETTGLSNSYELVSGTSISAPFVSGIAALILSSNPSINPFKLRSIILTTVDKSLDSSTASKIASGGRVNANHAICKACIPKGDISGDGKVDITDAILALQVLEGLKPNICDTCLIWSLDINGDRRIGIEEVLYILRLLADQNHQK